MSDSNMSFYRVELPSLKDVRGAFNMQSSGQLNCDKLSDFDGDVTKGKYTCFSEVKDPGKEGTTPDDSNGDGSSGGKDAAALDRVSLTYVVGFAGLAGAFLQFL